MTPRTILLRKEHMAHLLDHPALDIMDDRELTALEQFMRFCATQGLDVPDAVDIEAFTALTTPTPREIELLARALERFGVGPVLRKTLRETQEKLRRRTNFKGVTKGQNREYQRSVSVAVEDLPDVWQATLRKLDDEGTFAPAVIDRMQRRLGMFVWSALQAGLEPELNSVDAQRALYDDVRARSAAKNDGVPRWAYLRSTWEELHRFARAQGLSEDVLIGLGGTYQELVRLETQQESLKFGKIMAAGTTSSLLADAEEILAQAEKEKLAEKRWALRNRAAALAIGCAVPARPGDVLEHHVFGAGLYYEHNRCTYRFDYVPNKTSQAISEPLKIRMEPHWNKFIDALILQDQDPRYLHELRAKAMADLRPLYINYDGTPCVYGWYSRAWAAVTGTGGHIARTLIYDEFSDMGEFGIQYASTSNHQISEKIRAKYRSGVSIKKSYARAHEIMVGRVGSDDDISDLI